MSDKNGKPKSGKGGGTLRDETALYGRPNESKTADAIFNRFLKGVPSVSKESSADLSGALEEVAEEHARQEEVSQLSSLEPLRAFLEYKEGDNEELICDNDGNVRTRFHERVIGRIDVLKELRRDIVMEEGEEGPRVNTINAELLSLDKLVPRGEGSILDGNSGLFDIDLIRQQEEKRKSEPPRESAESIGPELEAEGMEVPVVKVGEGVEINVDELDEPATEPRGLGITNQEPGGLERTSAWQVPAMPREEKAVVPEEEKDAKDLTDSWFDEEAGQPRNSEIEARDSIIVEAGYTLENEAGETAIAPLDAKEKEMLERLSELTPTELREMALARRFKAEDIREAHGGESHVLEEDSKNEYDGLERQAEVLEQESDNRAKARRNALDSWETSEARAEAEGRLDTGTRVLKTDSAPREEKPAGMGRQKQERRPRQETMVALREAKAAPAGKGSRESSGLSRTGLFADFNADEELSEIAEEGSKAELLSGIMGNGTKEKEQSRRMDTGALRRGEAGELSSLENTSIRVPRENKHETERKDRKIDRPLTPEEMARTRLSIPEEDLEITAVVETLEDFSRYGDIYYAIEKTFIESGIKRKGGRELIAEIDEAIKLNDEIIANGGELPYDADITGVSPEMRRKERLSAFKREFIVEGEDGPRNSIEKYDAWIEAKKSEYEEAIGDVFDILGVSPGEYSRRGVLRVCDACLETETLSEHEKNSVMRLKSILEPEAKEGDDEFAAERTGELMHEMIVGLGTKRDRELRRDQAKGIEKETAKKLEFEFQVHTLEEKQRRITAALAELYGATRVADSKLEGMEEYLSEARVARMEIAPEVEKRDRQIRAMCQIATGKRGPEEMLGEKEKKKIEWDVRKARKETEEMALLEAAKQELKRKRSGVGKGIATAGLPLVGAAILAGGLWLGQHGITLPFGNGNAMPEKEVAAEVQDAATEMDSETGFPAGVAEIPEAEPETDTGLRGMEPEEPEEAKTVEEKEVQETVPEEHVAEVQEATPEKTQVEPEHSEELPDGEIERTSEGLRLALDDWCGIAEYALVEKEMLRAAYASIEEKTIKRAEKDGKEIPLPGDASWPKTMLRTTFDNQVYEIAVMSDLWRLSGRSIEPEERYAAGMRLAALLGYGAGDKKTFSDRIKILNKRNKLKDRKRETVTPEIPKLAKGSILGATEYHKLGNGYGKYTPWQSNCLLCALYDTVIEDLNELVEREKIIVAQDAVLEKLGKTREVDEGKYQEIAGKVEELGHYFMKKTFDEKVIKAIEDAAGEGASVIVEKIRQKGLYKGLVDDLGKIKGLEERDSAELAEQVREIKKDKLAKQASERYMERALEAIVESTLNEFEKEKTAEKFAERMGKLMERAMKERNREFMGKVRIALGALDDKTFKKFKNAKWEANGPKKTKKLAEACRVLTQGKHGMDALERGRKVKREWDWIRLKKKRQEAKRQAEAEKLTEGAIENKKQLKEHREKADKLKEKARKKKKGGSGQVKKRRDEGNLEFLERQFEKMQQSELKKNAEERRRDLFSYRGGVETGKTGEAKRLEKKEAYLAQFRVRMGVEDRKPSPFKKMASKLKMNGGLERAVARA